MGLSPLGHAYLQTWTHPLMAPKLSWPGALRTCLSWRSQESSEGGAHSYLMLPGSQHFCRDHTLLPVGTQLGVFPLVHGPGDKVGVSKLFMFPDADFTLVASQAPLGMSTRVTARAIPG